jgi:hypothetical protein
MIGVTTKYTIVGTGSVWEYVDQDGIEYGGVGGSTAGPAFGVYQPTTTPQTNVAAASASAEGFMFTRRGNFVHFAGQLSVTATANSVTTEVRINPPIASNFTSAEDASGGAFADTAAGTANGPIRIEAEPTSNLIRIRYTAGTGATSARTLHVQGMYRLR